MHESRLPKYLATGRGQERRERRARAVCFGGGPRRVEARETRETRARAVCFGGCPLQQRRVESYTRRGSGGGSNQQPTEPRRRATHFRIASVSLAVACGWPVSAVVKKPGTFASVSMTSRDNTPRPNQPVRRAGRRVIRFLSESRSGRGRRGEVTPSPTRRATPPPARLRHTCWCEGSSPLDSSFLLGHVIFSRPLTSFARVARSLSICLCLCLCFCLCLCLCRSRSGSRSRSLSLSLSLSRPTTPSLVRDRSRALSLRRTGHNAPRPRRSTTCPSCGT